ncbi:MAG: malate dehydrogenase [Desulfurococcales archaeon]|nr:malate dehydrogenase [Desulfurococcales archaeon]
MVKGLITIVGAGRVGTSAALFLMLKELDDILLIDIIKGRPQGEALDLAHAASILGLSVDIRGSNNFEDMKGSQLVLVTAGFPRKPGMTREELLEKNAGIVADVADKIKKYAPDSIVILTTNPLDAMTYVMYKELGWDRSRVIGFSGVLDAGRLAYYASKKLGVSPASIVPIVLGMHGQAMLPVPRLSTVSGAPLDTLLSQEDIEEIVEETVQAGAKITELRGYSSSYGPGAGLAVMAESVIKDQNKVFISSVVLDGEYGYKNVVAEVPVIVGKEGAKKIIELPLTEDEKKKLDESVNAVKELINRLPEKYRS